MGEKLVNMCSRSTETCRQVREQRNVHNRYAKTRTKIYIRQENDETRKQDEKIKDKE